MTTRKRATAADAAPNLSAAIADIERAAPLPPAPTTTPHPQTKPIPPANVVVNGRGAFRFIRTGNANAGSYEWDANAPAVASMPLPLSSDVIGLLRVVATERGIDRQGFVDFCRKRTQEVRAACRIHRDGGQRSAFDALVAAYKQESTQS